MAAADMGFLKRRPALGSVAARRYTRSGGTIRGNAAAPTDHAGLPGKASAG